MKIGSYEAAGDVLKVVKHEDLKFVADQIRIEDRAHEPEATCECVAFRAIEALLSLGYKIVPRDG
jgi:hypothetical protein